MLLKTADITIDETLTPRFGLDDATVEAYSDAIMAGASFPPILVGKDQEGRYVLIDGHHRLTAQDLCSKDSIEVEVTKLLKSQWLIEACRRNSTHGLPLKEQEKYVAAARLAKEGFNDEQIAKAIGVAAKLLEERRDKRNAAKRDTPDSKRNAGAAFGGIYRKQSNEPVKPDTGALNDALIVVIEAVEDARIKEHHVGLMQRLSTALVKWTRNRQTAKSR